MTNFSHFPDPELLDRYLVGEATPDECQAIAQWAEAAGERDRLAVLRLGVVDPVGPLPSFDVPVRVASIVDYSVRAARRNRKRSMVRGPVISVERRVHRLARWGATIALTAGIVLAVGVWHGVGTERVAQHPAGAAEQVYRTHNGERATITLPDQSTVVLGPASTLSVASDFGAPERVVTVSGEAYFTVHANTRHPFLVTAHGAIVRVLGTAFAVRRYATDSILRVAVAQGRVSLRAHSFPNASEAILSAGVLGVVLDSGQIVVTSNVDVNDYTSWTTGALVLHNMPLRDAIVELERRYDIRVQLSDSTLGQQTLTATFGDEPITQVLDALSLALHVQYTRSGPNGRVIVFTPARKVIERAAPSRNISPTAPEAQYGR